MDVLNVNLGHGRGCTVPLQLHVCRFASTVKVFFFLHQAQAQKTLISLNRLDKNTLQNEWTFPSELHVTAAPPWMNSNTIPARFTPLELEWDLFDYSSMGSRWSIICHWPDPWLLLHLLLLTLTDAIVTALTDTMEYLCCKQQRLIFFFFFLILFLHKTPLKCDFITISQTKIAT